MTQPPGEQPDHPDHAGPPPAYQQPGGYAPYGAPPPGHAGHPPYPPSPGGSGKTVAIIVGAIVLFVVLFCAGIFAAVLWVIDSVEDQIDSFDPSRPGGSNNPIEVAFGEAFEIDGIKYGGGWRLSDATDGRDRDDVTIVDLKATNDREDERADYVSLRFTFLSADDTELAEVSCTSDGRIGHGHSEKLECRGSDRLPVRYDRIEVSEG